MTVRGHILFMLGASILAWIAWLLIVMTVRPTTAPWWGLVLFFIMLFLSLFGTFTTLGFTVRSIFSHGRRSVQYRVSASLRQGFLWALALVSSLALQGARILSWWIFILIIIVFGLLEFFLASGAHEQTNG